MYCFVLFDRDLGLASFSVPYSLSANEPALKKKADSLSVHVFHSVENLGMQRGKSAK